MRRRTKILLALLGTVALLAGGLAWRLHTWGRPLPMVYEPVSVTPADAHGGRSITYQRRNQQGEPVGTVVTLDTDGDGVVDLALEEGSAVRSFARPRPDDPEARWLILCLDGVPYDEFLALWEHGHFREFFRPVPVISPFPSASGLALTALFHSAPVAGYEDGYFDRARNQLAGGALKTTLLSDIPYLERLDYDLPGWSRGLAYMLPVKNYRADLGRLRTRFLASGQRVFVAHVASTDSVYHVLPREQVRELLAEVETLLRELYLSAQGKLRITLFSDHGNSLALGHSVPLQEHLEARGWRRADQLGAERDVVVPAYGLMGYFAAYCEPAQRAALARDLATMEGVDIAVYAEGNGVAIESPRGRARLEWNQDATAFRYRPDTGDALQLAETLGRLKEEGKTDADGWVEDADLFAATLDHAYPDPARRLWEMATNHVQNRAQVVVSLLPGYHQGSGAFEHLVTMRSAHGAFDRAQSLGFATSTDGALEGPVRAADLLPARLDH